MTGKMWMVLALTASSVLAADVAYYAKKGTWHETLIASREALVAYEAEQAKKAEAAKPVKVGDPSAPTLDLWHSVGPFVPKSGSGFAFAYPPEKEPGLMAADEASAELDGVRPADALTKSYGKLRWTPQPNFRDGVPTSLSAPSNGSTYLYRTIHAPKDMTATGYFGSDDGMRAWLNGKVIVSIDTPRGHSPNQNTAKLALKKGANHLLLKIHNNSGGHGFYFSTNPQPASGGQKADPRQIARDSLWNLIRRDFATAHREMGWERQDGIWTLDWKAG
ncbi:hypothetical protein HQ560_10880, partial [bacterium]|nr:hypothetical protein [bacterium]